MITAAQFVDQAENGGYLGIPYKDMDCQAFVERVLSDAGETGHNWRGSNHMWRDALSEKHTEINKAEVPAGAWLFTLRYDGGEKERGYTDGEGNAKHVGIYLGNGKVIHSTSAGSAGVQMDRITSARWNAWGLCKYIQYTSDRPNINDAISALNTIYRFITGGAS